MYEAVTGLDWLSDQFATFNQRLAVTVAAWGLMLVVLLSSQSFQRWLNERTRPLYSDIVTTVLLVATFVVSVAVSLGVWGQTETASQELSEHELGGDVIATIVVSFVVVVSTYIVARFVRRLIQEVLASSTAVTDHQREVTHRLSQVMIWGTAFIVILGIWVDDLGGLLIGAGFLGIVLGMAARQTLGAMLAGFVLMFDRPFEIGDWIEIDDQEGIVTDISIVNTRIQSFDGEYVMVPNDVVGSQMVTNRSKRGRLRVEVDVGVDYETDVDRASDLAREAVKELDEVMDGPSPQVVTKEFGESGILLGVRFWIDRPNSSRRWRARTAAIGAIKSAFEDAGIKIPYPQRELSGRAETGGFRVADGAETTDERRGKRREQEQERDTTPSQHEDD
ncbi:mechanosensitive ion channel family protein [Halobacteria archaeon AArc-m2/3/4]|uniref:Mechanosensitive ion channel family protein n=1 Tax=Natronoglomus mannanivorans TaxID=2979990 RepID=A0ABT2Q8L2_9EURY|nr:mechanosensitive ion channel family protein [Halobacteria archaeon AArc-m2/3/4]